MGSQPDGSAIPQALAPASGAGARRNRRHHGHPRPAPARRLSGYAAKAATGGADASRLAIRLALAVRVNGVSPGPIEWPEDEQFPPAERERASSPIPRRRPRRQPDDIARASVALPDVRRAPRQSPARSSLDGGAVRHFGSRLLTTSVNAPSPRITQRHEPLPPDRPPNGPPAAALGTGGGCPKRTWRAMWSTWSRRWTCRRWSGRMRAWERCLPPGDAAVAADLRLRDGDAFEPPDRAGDMPIRWRLGSSPATSTRTTTPGEFPAPRFGEQFAELFVQVLQVARENQLSRFGTVSLDGTKLHANASRHSALSYGHAQKTEAQLKAEVQEMLKLAEAADQGNVPEGWICRRRSSGAKTVWRPSRRPKPRSRPAKERFEREQNRVRGEDGQAQGQTGEHGQEARWQTPSPRRRGHRPRIR